MELDIKNGFFVVKLSKLERMLSSQDSFNIPLNDISGVDTEVPETSFLDFGLLSVYFPFVVRAGTYHTSRGKEFWCAVGEDYREKNYLNIELYAGLYKRIILAVGNNNDWARALDNVINRKTYFK